jgi:hypothetical protein
MGLAFRKELRPGRAGGHPMMDRGWRLKHRRKMTIAA